MYSPVTLKVLTMGACLLMLFGASAQVTPVMELPGYSSARQCVQNCEQSAVAGNFAYGCLQVGCQQKNPVPCFCGTIGSVYASISRFVYSCASQACSNTIEASSAAAIFYKYCIANGVAPVVEVVTTQTAAIVTSTPIPTADSTATSTASSVASWPITPGATGEYGLLLVGILVCSAATDLG
jgi:hypothetical protein